MTDKVRIIEGIRHDVVKVKEYGIGGVGPRGPKEYIGERGYQGLQVSKGPKESKGLVLMKFG